MSTIAYLNGTYVDADQAVLPVTDWGFLQGVAVAEQLRTFRQEPFLINEHLDRLLNGLRIIGLPDACPRDELVKAIHHVLRHNVAECDTDNDVGITVFVTPGIYPIYDPDHISSPHIGVHTYPLPFRFWSHKYSAGQPLTSVGIQQIPASCWPPDLKCRSRMHYYLAAREARSVDAESAALLLDQEGHVSETPTANIVGYFPDEGLVSPKHETILPGVSLRFLRQLADQLELPWVERALTTEDLMAASELMLTSTPYGILPVSRLNGTAFATPGTVCQALTKRWSDEVGVDLAGQARRFS